MRRIGLPASIRARLGSQSDPTQNMRLHFAFAFRRFFAFAGLLCLLSSCITQPQLLYMQPLGADPAAASRETAEFEHEETAYLVQPADVLDIKISTPDPKSMALFDNQEIGQMGGQVNDASLFVNGYTVNQDGNINLPIVGEVEVVGQTVDQIAARLQQEVDRYFKEARVAVRMVSFRVSVIGEVRRAGTFQIYNQRATIFQALALAGDATDLANRRRVQVVRMGSERSQVFYADLSDPQIVTKEYYFLRPNDVVYVEPIEQKSKRLNLPIVQLVISGLSTAILLANVAVNLSR